MIRKSHGLSQVELAKRLNVSQSVISLIESGQSSVSLEILKKFSREFDLSSDWLIYGKSRYIKLSAENHFMPLINIKAQAHYQEKPGDAVPEGGLPLYRVPGFEDGNSRIFEVEADHMVPTVHPKDMLICQKVEKNQFRPEGELYLLVTKNGVLPKRVYRKEKSSDMLVLKNDSNHYHNEEIGISSVQEIWVVRGKITSKFMDYSFANTERMDRLESEMEWIRNEIESLLVLQPHKEQKTEGHQDSNLLAPSAVISPVQTGRNH